MRVFVVTGASSGIGEATVRRLKQEPDVHVVGVARRAERLAGLCDSSVAVDLVDEDAPARVRTHLEEHFGGRLDLLVNNAGASWRGDFGDKGWENVRRTMEINFDAQVRLTEALLPLLRASAPSALVNVASTAGRVSRAGAGAYSASKFALIGWSEALHLEERAHGVHVGVVNPGFISTEGFPQKELTDRAATRWLVSTPEAGAEAIADCALNGRAERYVPRAYGLVPVLRVLVPGLVRRLTGGGAGSAVTPTTSVDREGSAA